MKIKKITIKNFKRFSDLNISGMPDSAKLILLVGPNGCGKTSLFEAMNHWYKYRGFGNVGDRKYLEKNTEAETASNWNYGGAVKIEFFDPPGSNQADIHGKFYFRTAYRNEPDFSIQALKPLDSPLTAGRNNSRILIDNDVTVSENYQRLVADTISSVYTPENGNRFVKDLKEELIGKVKQAMINVFPDLALKDIGQHPLENGSFYFEKGISKNFHYKNLSSGEKSVFDLLLDIIIKSKYYTNTIFCIDEPEAHMHTSLQSKILREMYNLVPENSQLWISTHSLGMLNEAREIEKDNENTVVFLDLGKEDFDSETTIVPSKIETPLWNKFLEFAIGDFANLIVPKRIILCEGDPTGHGNNSFDADIYNTIFANHLDTRFISVGSKSEVERSKIGASLKKIMPKVRFLKLTDRDDANEEEIAKGGMDGIIALKKRSIENYLYDDEILKKLCDENEKPDSKNECLEAKKNILAENKNKGKPSDDVKYASGQIYIEIKKILDLKQCGTNAPAFARSTLASLITESTDVYKELESEIFQHSQSDTQK